MSIPAAKVVMTEPSNKKLRKGRRDRFLRTAFIYDRQHHASCDTRLSLLIEDDLDSVLYLSDADHNPLSEAVVSEQRGSAL